MLKSQVSVALCALLFCNVLSAGASPWLPGAPAPGGSVPVPPVADYSVVSHASSVSFALHGRQMRKFVTSYLKANNEDLALARDRSQRPFTIIDSVMETYDLPVELRYLAVIESNLQPMAISRVGARGPWQLMAGTARELGLKVSRRYDERTNYYKSTRAAALYLRDLHREFRDWLLVLAAYNAGPVPVERAIRLAGSRSFWALERYLPAETRQHVKRFIATEYYFTLCQQWEDQAPANSVCRRAGTGGVLTAFIPGPGMIATHPVTLPVYLLGQNDPAPSGNGDRVSTGDMGSATAGLGTDAARREESPDLAPRNAFAF